MTWAKAGNINWDTGVTLRANLGCQPFPQAADGIGVRSDESKTKTYTSIVARVLLEWRQASFQQDRSFILLYNPLPRDLFDSFSCA